MALLPVKTNFRGPAPKMSEYKYNPVLYDFNNLGHSYDSISNTVQSKRDFYRFGNGLLARPQFLNSTSRLKSDYSVLNLLLRRYALISDRKLCNFFHMYSGWPMGRNMYHLSSYESFYQINSPFSKQCNSQDEQLTYCYGW